MSDMLEALISQGKAASAQAMAVFDALEPVSVEFMLGRWRGREIATGHPMDGLLDRSGWHGKWFVDAEQVHPLLFRRRDGQGLYAVDPHLIPMDARMGRLKVVPAGLAGLVMPLLRTRDSKARLRLISHRGRMTASMIYDEKPINDVFRRIDDQRVLGVMDLKGISQPYFFLLERDDDSPLPVDL